VLQDAGIRLTEMPLARTEQPQARQAARCDREANAKSMCQPAVRGEEFPSECAALESGWFHHLVDAHRPHRFRHVVYTILARQRILQHFAAQASHLLRQQAEHERAESERADAVALMDELETPCFIVEEDATLLSSNTAAKRLIRKNGPFRLRGEILEARSGTGNDSHNPIAALIDDHRSRPGRTRKHGFEVTMLRDDNSCRARWFAFAVRLHAACRGDKARYAIVIGDAEKADARIGVDQLQHLFGFTPTEARVMQALLDGHTTTSIANIMGVRCDTVRAHIKSLLAKTGLRSHAELQKLLMRITPEFRTE
jgi:DNA-binding CsgD family transcriptional regulator